ncbi:hypothetical protein FE257_000855 [Aspergillus nanangensis]|uniref:FAD-binding domain-containing protein n=1 Tax=Aspergillus nanangensis TaxID=2582783 RepID=A0AAD4CED5_ASPNN|nr:hypothetical protein FE257_000855 [Aspergillus nanangensis]
MPDYETVDVLICGCGPTGAMLSGYLGSMGVPNIVLEKEPHINTDPRGIALDDDGIRYLQGLGLYQHIFTDIGSCISRIRFVDGIHHDLQKEPFLSFDMGSSEGNTGHVGVIAHKQPVLEKHLRSVLDVSKFSDLRSGCTLTAIREDDDWVYATYTNAADEEHQIRCQFMVAADGKTGFTRKGYLEPKGIRLEWAEQTKYNETWVALNWKIHLPTQETHPSFPLWNLGYSPEEVYDLFFPADFRFLCNAHRPAVCGRFGLPDDRLWRFEFVVGPDEDGTEMAEKQKIRETVVPYITHPGRRYGLQEDVEFPEDCIEVLRSRPFGFSARSCNKWALGRVILSGDAAHVFPPFGGQGIASGFRDAVGLAWRLAILCSSPKKLDHESILTAWYQERKQQLDRSLASTVRNGSLVNTPSAIHGYLRNWVLWGMKLVPQWKHALERGPRADGPIRYSHMPGFPFLPEFHGGLYFPQTYCTAVMEEEAHVQFTDDVIFSADKKALLQIVVLLEDPDQVRSAVAELNQLKAVETHHLSADEATYFVPRASMRADSRREDLDLVQGRLFRSANADEFTQSPLCGNRPTPRGYREALLWESTVGKRYVILRPDRFIFAACGSGMEVEEAARRLKAMFS